MDLNLSIALQLISPSRWFCCCLFFVWPCGCTLWGFFYSCFVLFIVSYCCVQWIVFSHCDHLAGEEETGCFPDGPITARYRFTKNASWVPFLCFFFFFFFFFFCLCTICLGLLTLPLGAIVIKLYHFTSTDCAKQMLNRLACVCL